jgi:ABC-2 type transport system ATP-binding protein
VPGIKVLSRDAGLNVALQIEGEMDELIKALGSLPVSYLDTARPSLEEVFLAYYEAEQNHEEGI